MLLEARMLSGTILQVFTILLNINSKISLFWMGFAQKQSFKASLQFSCTQSQIVIAMILK